VFDYVTTQLDRGLHHNYVGHPDDPSRMILIDNGLSLPAVTELPCHSLFCKLWINTPLSQPTLDVLQRLSTDVATWADVRVLVGDQATEHAQVCVQRLLADKMLTLDPESEAYTTGYGYSS
jgi:hypothetical protein